MFKTLAKTLLLVVGFFGVNQAVLADNMRKFDNLEVHYIGLPSIILQPNIAKTYGIERSRYNGFVNISVLDSSVEGKPALNVGLSGTAINLAGQRIALDFDKITEGKAIYYIAQLKYTDQEIIKFELLINDNGKQHTLKFQQKFYVEE